MVTAATAGDGVSAGPGSISSGITILRRATTLVLTDDGPDTIGRAPREIRAHVAPVGGQFFTPPAVSAVGVWAGSVRASCDASGACLLPEYAVPVGDSTVTGSYPGDDADFLPSGGSVEIHAGARRSDLSYTLDPPNPFAWQSGQQVTVTWTVTTTGAPARGRAVFGIGPSSCEGPALAGSCVVAVPAWDGEGPMPAWDFTREYRPSDDAPAIRDVLPLAPRSCVRVTVARGIVTPASNCSTGAGPGYLTGTDVEVVPDLPTGWHVDSWSINGGLVADSRDGTSDPAMPAAYDFFRFRVTGNAAAAYTYRWTPVCVTLRLAADPYRDWSPEAVGGRTYVITRPNCASPSSPTALELADAARGYYRFAQGTEVELLAYPLNPYGNDPAQIVDRPAFALDTWVNAVADRVVPRLARLTITDDTNAGAVFKVAHCVPTNVLASEGGTVSIRETIRPASSQFLRPVTGACTDQAGRPGFVPGTTAVMDVRPANDGSDRPPAERSQYFFETVSTGTSAPAASAHGDLGPADRYHPLQAEATIPAAFGRTVGLAGQFGHVACVPLTTRLELPADADVPSVGYSDAPNCRAKPTTTAVEYMEGSFAARIQTAWFVEGSQASVAIGTPRVSVRYPTRTVDPNLFLGDWAGLAQARGDERGSEDVLEPVWGVARPGHPAAPTDDISRSQLLDQGADPVLLGRWMSKLCRSLGVYAPTGGSVRVAPATPQCRSGYAPAYVTSLELYVEGGPTDRLLTPWFSVSGSDEDKGAFLGERTETGNGGRLYTKGSPESRTDFSTYNASKVMLEFCAEIDYSVRVQDAAGNIAPLDTEKLPLGAVVETDGGCPKGWARPGRTVTVGLTEPANYAFEVIGPEFHKAATLTVDAAGNASRHVDYLLRPFCYRLSVGSRVDIRTPADCPGGDGMQYLRGDVVQLDVNVDPGETFEGWTNVTSSDGNTAFVAMTQDMATGTTIDYPTDLEKFGAAVSSTVQRVVGLVATIGTGLLLAQRAALTVATVAMRAASALAGALGASDAVVHAIDAQAEYMAAQVRIVNALATCTSRWAAGGSGTLVPGGEAGAGIAAANAVAVNRASNVLQNSAGYSAEGAGAVTVALNPVSWVNAFGSHAENYLQDPAEAWSSIGDIGTCMQAEFEASQVSMGIRPAP
jgi:hypothetical protein